MKSNFLDDLVKEHLTDHEADQHGACRRTAYICLLSGLVSALGLLGLIGLRHDMSSAAVTTIFWLKIIFPLSLALLSAAALWRLVHPGHAFATWTHAIALCVMVFWCLSVLVLPPLSTEILIQEFWGETWLECIGYISLLSLPLTAALLFVTRSCGVLLPRWSGFFCGLCAGTSAAALYALHCREPGLLFLGSWYLLGAAIPAVAGAWIAPRLLAWSD